MGERLTGKRVFVTAAGQGIGRAAALAFAAEGAEVWATDANPDTVRSLEALAPITTRPLDVTDGAAILAVAADAGEMDVLFNCAGIVPQGTLLECSEQDWSRSLDVNVTSMFRVTRAFLPGMLARGRGSIINMASVCSSLRGLPNRLAYGTTKAAVIGLTKSIAADYVARGIRCNAVCPGTVDTPSLQARINTSADPVRTREAFIARQPMGRLATVDDITPLLVYLASDESLCATGGVFSVDGGMTI